MRFSVNLIETIKIIFSLFCFLITLNYVYSEEIGNSYYSTETSLSIINKGNFVFPELENSHILSEPDFVGKPVVYSKQFKLLIPADAGNITVSSRIIISDTIKLNGIPYPAQPIIPISIDMVDSIIMDSSFYQSSLIYPESSSEIVGVGTKNGWKIAVIDLYPIQYIPAESIIIFNEQIHYSIEFDNSDTQSLLPDNIVNSSRKEVMRLIDNTSDIDLYEPSSTELAEGIDYCVIIPNKWEKHINPLIQWKHKKGLNCKIVSFEHIHDTIVNALDQEEKMRAYIDWMITVSIDRLKGNPNREANIRIFEYEVFEEETWTSGNSYYAFNTVNKLENIHYDYSLRINSLSNSKEIYYTVPSSEHVSIALFDITGRQIMQIFNGYANKGKNTLHIEDKLS